MAALIRRLLHEAYEALRAYGAIHVSGAWDHPGTPWPDGRPARLDGPPRAHLERLRPDVALTPVERALERELKAGP